MYLSLSFSEVQMYLIVLEELNKYEEAIEVVTGPLGGMYLSTLVLKARIISPNKYYY